MFSKKALVDINPVVGELVLDVLLTEVHSTESAQISLSTHYLSPSDIALHTGLDKLYVNFLEEASAPPTVVSIFESYFILKETFQGESAANKKQVNCTGVTRIVVDIDLCFNPDRIYSRKYCVRLVRMKASTTCSTC